MDLSTNGNSVFLLKYDLVLCVMGRRNVITSEISDRLKEIFINTTEKYGITLDKWGYEADYISLSFRAKPSSELTKMLNAYKSAASRRIKNEFPEIKSSLYKDCFWSKSYYLVTTGCNSMDNVRAYIETQLEN